jgi:hypothetical protein
MSQVHKPTAHYLRSQRVWAVLIFLLTFFIKKKSKARLAKPSYRTRQVER